MKLPSLQLLREETENDHFSTLREEKRKEFREKNKRR